MVLQHVYPKKEGLPRLAPDSILDNGCLRMEVLLEKALPLLDRDVVFSLYTQNSSSWPSEYVFQAELYSTLRALLSSTTYKVLPEAKDRNKLGRRRVDILLINSRKVVIELKANLTTEQGFRKAARQAASYGRALQAQQTIVLNFVPAGASLPSSSASLFPLSESVTTFHVLLNKGFADIAVLTPALCKGQDPKRKVLVQEWESAQQGMKGKREGGKEGWGASEARRKVDLYMGLYTMTL